VPRAAANDAADPTPSGRWWTEPFSPGFVASGRRCRWLKTDLDFRSIYYREADRIAAHVLLCWLVLLLVRVCEVRCGRTWRQIRQEMDRLQRGGFEGPAASRRAPS